MCRSSVTASTAATRTRSIICACSTCDKREHISTIDLRPYIAPHTLKLGPDGLIYLTCENSAVVVVIDPDDQHAWSRRSTPARPTAIA